MNETYCNLEYRVLIPVRELDIHKGEIGFCLVRDTRCPYYKNGRNHDYCRYNKEVKK